MLAVTVTVYPPIGSDPTLGIVQESAEESMATMRRVLNLAGWATDAPADSRQATFRKAGVGDLVLRLEEVVP